MIGKEIIMLTIRKIGDKVLEKKSKRIAKIDDTIRTFCSSMVDAMIFNQGVGLSAPQVGVNKQIVVAIINESPKCFINPEIIKHSETTEVCDEGCLSIPETFVPVKRYKSITIKYRDLSGKPRIDTYQNLEARILQHEIDHLWGKLVV